MLFKNIAIGLLSLFLIGNAIPTEAGMVSKAAKGYVAAKLAQKAAPIIAKKIAQNKAKKVAQDGVKDSTKPLMKKELKVGDYGKLKQSPEKGVDYHHMPSSKQMEKYGVKKDDGIAIGVEKDRHSLTRTYKGRNKEHLGNNEKPRESLGRDVKDARQIYQDNNQYNKNVRESLQETIKKNKEKFPDLYKKQ
jgi:hypothetical protein